MVSASRLFAIWVLAFVLLLSGLVAQFLWHQSSKAEAREKGTVRFVEANPRQVPLVARFELASKGLSTETFSPQEQIVISALRETREAAVAEVRAPWPLSDFMRKTSPLQIAPAN